MCKSASRTSGILMHLTSLPSPYGIGTMGRAAREFVDFLAAAGQAYWQILPIGPTGYGDSPYQSFSTFAGNPYLIDLDLLAQDSLLHEEEFHAIDWGEDPQRVDYDKILAHRLAVLRIALERFRQQHANPLPLQSFREQNAFWLLDYALYMALKTHFGGKPLSEWETDIRTRKPEAMQSYATLLADDIAFWEFVQYLFFSQWNALKKYAQDAGIRLIGDIPIYVAADSADVWANPSLFQLGDDLRPIDVSGCPPDAFSADGQLWGNPLYRWDIMAEDGFTWWIQRIRACMNMVDVIRIDHFRGFDSYYAIPAGEETARRGEWRQGPGIAFFRALNTALPSAKVIAEDLGFLTASVRHMQKQSGYPGMKVLQFAFDSREESDYLPHNYEKNCVVYTGTHDNDTTVGWFDSAPKADVSFCKKYLYIQCGDEPHWAMLRAAWASVANTAIAPMQDFLGLSSEARMNTPSTVGGNWCWRVQPDALTSELGSRILEMTRLYGRANP